MEASLHKHPVPRPPRPELLPIVWTHRAKLGLGLGVGLVLGLVVALTLPTKFSSTATIMFPSAPTSKLSLLGGGGGSDLPSVPLLEGALLVPQPGTSGATAQLLLKSRRAKHDVLAKLKDDGLDLQQVWGVNTHDAMKRLAENMVLEVGKQGELYVGFREEARGFLGMGDPTCPDRATRITQTMVDELGLLTKELGLNPAEQDVEFLKNQVADAERRFNKAEDDLLAFQQAHHIVSLPDQAQALAQQYAKLQQDAAQARLEATIAARQANLTSTTVGKMIQECMDPVPGPNTNNTLQPLYQKVVQTESELAVLRDRLTPQHPDVQEKMQQLNEARRILKEEIERQLRMLKSGSSPAVNTVVVQAAVSQAKAGGVQQALQDLQQQVRQMPARSAAYIRLSAEVEATTTEVKMFRQELAKARVLVQSRGPLFVVSDPPEKPVEHDPTGRGKVLIVITLLGLVASLLAPYREWAGRQREYEEAIWQEQTAGTR